MPNGDKILSLGDQVKVERILPKESLGKVVPSLDRGHVKGSEPLERRAGQTLLEQTDQEPIVSLKLRKVSTVCFQMGDRAASTIVLFEFQDAKLHWECRLWKETEVPKSVGLAVCALH